MLGWATMATGYLAPVTALQVGSYFVGQYYQILQQQPNLVHQFYTDLSTSIHVYGSSAETTASGMLQIHNLIMSLNFAGIEIKTAHSLESWNGGILVIVSGSVQTEQFSRWRRFAQTFFLAPQEKGYFILNDIFQLHDEEQMRQHRAPISIHNNFHSKINDSKSAPEAVNNFMHEREAHMNNVTIPAYVEESGPTDKYNIPESDDAEEDEIPSEEAIDSYFLEQPDPTEEPVDEPTKHTYASILRVTKAPSSTTRTAIVLPEPEQSKFFHEKSGNCSEDEGEVKSVYVRNLPSMASASDLEHEFKNFGRIKPDGVLIKTRKEAGVYYAFIEFEDISGVQNALKASPILFGGRQIYVEERRLASQGARGRRMMIRGNQSEAAPQRVRLGSNSRSKGRGILGPQAVLKNGHRSSVDSV